MLFSDEWENKHTSAAAARNLETVLYINEPFDVGMESSKLGIKSLTNRLETVADNEVLREVVEKNVGNAAKDYAELVVSPTSISRHLKLIFKVQKMDMWVPHKLNKNHKRKRFEISSALHETLKP